MGSKLLKSVGDALGIQSAAGRLEQQRAKLDKFKADKIDLTQKVATLESELGTVLDDADAFDRTSQLLENAKRLRIRSEMLIERESQNLKAAERDALLEELEAVTKQAEEARDRMFTTDDDLARKEDAVRAASDERTRAQWASEQHFSRARELAGQLSVPVPKSCEHPAGVVSSVRLQCTRYDLGFARVPEKQQPEAEYQLLKALLSTYQLGDAYANQDRYSNADRLRDLRKGPEVFSRRVQELAAEDAAQLALSTARREKEERERADAEYAAREANAVWR